MVRAHGWTRPGWQRAVPRALARLVAGIADALLAKLALLIAADCSRRQYHKPHNVNRRHIGIHRTTALDRHKILTVRGLS